MEHFWRIISCILIVWVSGGSNVSLLNKLISLNVDGGTENKAGTLLTLSPLVTKLLKANTEVINSLPVKQTSSGTLELPLLSEHLQKIHPSLSSQTSQDPLNDIIVSFGGNGPVLQEIQSSSFGSQTSKRWALMQGLQRHASDKQRATKSMLGSLNVNDFSSFWAENNMVIPNSPMELVHLLAGMNEVTKISKAQVFYPIAPAGSVNQSQGNETAYNLEMVNAYKVWKELRITGEGVTVATIDTGVRYTHVALISNWVGLEKHGWYDAYKQSSGPTDDQGHGTHTMGTICGKNVGVAPGAKWMTCKGCTESGCTSAALIACGQFIMCPTNTTFGVPNCSLAPDIVSNSWGSAIPSLPVVTDSTGDNFFDGTMNVWKIAGIFFLFASGNSGPACFSTVSPGNRQLPISVGAVTATRKIADYSSVGPVFQVSLNNLKEFDILLEKPNIAAPGDEVNSTYNMNDNSYTTLSGTSMATPCAAGVMALMLSQVRDPKSPSHLKTLPYNVAKCILEQSASRNVTKVILDVLCTSVIRELFGESEFPDNIYGWGIVDAFAALSAINGPPDSDIIRNCSKS